MSLATAAMLCTSCGLNLTTGHKFRTHTHISWHTVMTRVRAILILFLFGALCAAAWYLRPTVARMLEEKIRREIVADFARTDPVITTGNGT